MPVTGLLLLMGILVFSEIRAGGHFDYNENCMAACKALFQLRFQEAKLRLMEEGKKNPDNLIPHSLQNTLETLTLFISEDPILYSYYLKKREPLRNRLTDCDQSSPFARYCQAQFYLEWAVVRLKFHDYFQAARELKMAQSLFLENDKRFPGFLISQIGLGVTHVAGAMVPSEYRWITSFLGFEGSIERGISELRSVAFYQGRDSLTLIYRPQALFYMTFILLNFPSEIVTPESLEKRITSLFDDERNSPLMVYTLASLYLKMGLNARAKDVLSAFRQQQGMYPFYYLRYLSGITRLNDLDTGAGEDFKFYLDNFKGRSYRPSAIQRQAWIAVISGDTSGYISTIRKLKREQYRHNEDDAQSRQESANEKIPNVVLLKARVLCDGGYYQRALQELAGKPVSIYLVSERDNIEYHYRLGRIYQGLHLDNLALERFKKAVELGGNSGFYFAASAAYQSGVIYERNGDFKVAAIHYRKALILPAKEYRSGIRMKAKAGLERISGKIKT